MYTYVMEVFFVIGIASAIFAISLVVYSSIFFDKTKQVRESTVELPLKIKMRNKTHEM